MRIALVSWESLAGPAWTQTAEVVSATAQALAARGEEVHVFTASAPRQPPDNRHGTVTYHRCAHDEDPDPQGELDSFGRAVAFRLAREEREQRFDVVHGFDWAAAAALSELRRQEDRALVWSLSSDILAWERPAWLLDSPEAEPLHRYHPEEFADRILLPSTEARESFAARWGASPERLEVVHPGIDPDWLGPSVDPGSVKASYQIGVFDPTVLCIGPLTPRARPDVALDALFYLLDLHSQAKLIFAGDGELGEYLQDRARVLGLDQATRFPGHLPPAELARLCQSCDAVCLPQRSSSLLAPYLEAWSAGKPVIITRSHAACVFVWHEVTGYVSEDSAEGIARGAGWLFEDFDRCRWIGNNGRKAIEDAFGWPAISAKLLQCYQLVIAKRSPMVAPGAGMKAT